MELLICHCQHFVWKNFFAGWECILPESMTLVIRMLDPTVNSCFRISNPNAAFFLRDPSFIAQLPESHAIRFRSESSLAREHIKVCVLYCTFSVCFVCFYWGGGGGMFGMCGRGPMGNLACLQGWQFLWEVGQNQRWKTRGHPFFMITSPLF